MKGPARGLDCHGRPPQSIADGGLDADHDTTIVTAGEAGSSATDITLGTDNMAEDMIEVMRGAAGRLLPRAPGPGQRGGHGGWPMDHARAASRRLFEHRPGLPRPTGLDVGTR